MSELGERLKNARIEKNITLDKLQDLTKIQKRYLQAIEEGNFEILPGHFYSRAFVKSYAEAVGLDPDIIFEEHANELPNPNKQVTEIPPRVQARATRGTKKTRRFLALLPTVIAIIFIVSILIGFWYFLQSNSGGDEGIPRENVQSPVEGGKNDEALQLDEGKEVEKTPLVEEEQEEKPIEEIPKQELEILETKGNETIYNLLHASEFNFKIELVGKSYIGIDNHKGKSFHAANVDSGKVLTFDFSGEEKIQFNFGASNNAKLFINDEPFSFPQDVVHQKVTFILQKDNGE